MEIKTINKPLIKLENVGKIYVSNTNVSVGIRKVNLEFYSGEFVAITGESGSGKSTLLNVIAGIDSYEEGEMYVQNEPTSHYQQIDYEEYRKKYVSFVFQDYNILDSFTVLENVELALMNIKSLKERRKKALELIKRVGLEQHINHKGSFLSGGQKQRTIIARALAKDSPIILCDEPTGNLDSKSSKDIIALLKEISIDKLVIVVTHDFEDMKDVASRHIVITDGEISQDILLQERKNIQEEVQINELEEKSSFIQDTKDALFLAGAKFKSTPKYTFFLTLLFTILEIIIISVMSFYYRGTGTIDEAIGSLNKIFNYTDGRLVCTKQDATNFRDSDIVAIEGLKDVKNVVKYDKALDYVISFSYQNSGDYYSSIQYEVAYDESLDLKEDEVVVKGAINTQNFISKNNNIVLFGYNYNIKKVDYFYDNTKPNKIFFNQKSYKKIAASYYLSKGNMVSFTMPLNINSQTYSTFRTNYIYFDDELEKDQFYLNTEYSAYRKYLENNDVVTSITLNLLGEEFSQEEYIKNDLKNIRVPTSNIKRIIDNLVENSQERECLFVSRELYEKLVFEEFMDKTCDRVSIFFKSDGIARRNINKIESLGYKTLLSSYKAPLETYQIVLSFFMLGSFVFSFAIFIAITTMVLFFTTKRTMDAKKQDIGILRSMGISTRVIKTSVHLQNLYMLLISFVLSTVYAFVIFSNSITNGIFVFLHFGHYTIIVILMILISSILSNKHNKFQFNETVKRTLSKKGE